MVTHPYAIITFKKSNMILAIHSDASYLTEPRSRAGGHFYMADDDEEQPKGGSVHNVAQIIRNVMTSATDAEIGALYIKLRQAIPPAAVAGGDKPQAAAHPHPNRQHNCTT